MARDLGVSQMPSGEISTQSTVLFVHLVYYSQERNIMVLDVRI